MCRFNSLFEADDVYICIYFGIPTSSYFLFILDKLVIPLSSFYNEIIMAVSLQKRIRVRLFLVQFIAIIPLLIFIFYIFDLWYDSRKALVFQENITMAKVSALAVREAFSQGELIGSLLSNNDEMMSNLNKDKNKVKELLRNTLSSAPDFSSIMIYDMKGQLISGTSDISPETNNINISNRSYFKQAIESSKPLIANPVSDSTEQSHTIPLIQPIIKNNQTDGLIIVSYPVNILKKKIEETLTSNKTVIILDGDGNIVFSSNQPFSDESSRKLLANSDCYTAARLGNLHLIDNKHLPMLSKNVIGASSPVNHIGWVVISLDPIDEVFAPLVKVQNVIWLIIFSAVIFASALISYFLRKVKIIY